ncbi:MAG: hypothetical protein QM755_21865 [Luteolibacter sp.]
MLKERLPEKEKRQLAANILKRWAEVDPRGALTAALDARQKGWDQETNAIGILYAFDSSIADEPLVFLDLIGNREFGLDSGAVAQRWVETMSRRDPLLVLMSLDRLPGPNRADAIWLASREMPRHPDQREAILRELEKQRASITSPPNPH